MVLRHTIVWIIACEGDRQRADRLQECEYQRSPASVMRRRPNGLGSGFSRIGVSFRESLVPAGDMPEVGRPSSQNVFADIISKLHLVALHYTSSFAGGRSFFASAGLLASLLNLVASWLASDQPGIILPIT